MSETSDGKILYKLKAQYSDGTTHILFDPLELVEKVVALIPPPRANLLRYHGLLAPKCKSRKFIVPAGKNKKQNEEYPGQAKWAALLKHSFAIDILTCRRCGGKMKLIATIQESGIAKKILESVGLPFEVPMKSAARPPPQEELSDLQPADYSQLSSSNDSFE